MTAYNENYAPFGINRAVGLLKTAYKAQNSHMMAQWGARKLARVLARMESGEISRCYFESGHNLVFGEALL